MTTPSAAEMAEALAKEIALWCYIETPNNPAMGQTPTAVLNTNKAAVIIERALLASQEEVGRLQTIVDYHEALPILEKWWDTSEPMGAKVMSNNKSNLQTDRQKLHNHDEIAKLKDGVTYLLYDHYRAAFWGPNEGGYQYRKGAGFYTKQGAIAVLERSNRYFTIEEVPEHIHRALAARAALSAKKPDSANDSMNGKATA